MERALGAILLAALALRLWSIDHGLPFTYNADEDLHFVPVAVDMFRGSFNPDYFENPPALTYLLHAVFRLRFLEGFPFGSSGFARDFVADPEAAYLTARVVVAFAGTLAAGLVYWAGARFYDRRVGLIAAAVIALAFLPVFYSKHALNDAVTLVPVTVALVACLLVHRRGRALDWALAGAAIGVATATKYTAGATLAPLALAALWRLRGDRAGGRSGPRSPTAATVEQFGSPGPTKLFSRVATTPRREVVAGLVVSGAAFGAAFLVLNPFSLLDFGQFKSEVAGQGATAGLSEKLGQDDVPGLVYYAWTLTWGLGWIPALAAVAGAVLTVRRDRREALILLAFPLVLLVFLGLQERYFGRWLLPAYPAIAILAGYAAVRAADAIAPRVRLSPALVLAALVVLVAGQGLVSSVRVSSLLSEPDTRRLAREWMERNVPPGSRVVVEPFVPRGYLTIARGRSGPERFERFPIKGPFQAYEKRIQPALVDHYLREGYCWVVVGSHQKQRGLKAGLANARAYYERLAAASEPPVLFSPFAADAKPVEFNYDLSFNYLPAAYRRPGPVVEVYRLRGCPPLSNARRPASGRSPPAA